VFTPFLTRTGWGGGNGGKQGKQKGTEIIKKIKNPK
jgi:hypothetical protein